MGRRRASKRLTSSLFKFKPFSLKQKKILTWWMPGSPVQDYDGIIADGAIRSGKTLSMSLSFVIWAMETFDGQNFAMCGKTILSFRRNVLVWLKLMLRSRGYRYEDSRSDNLVTIWRGDTVNYFYIFGGKDERSQDLIQGITLAGVFFDEVALMPESFVNQATGRCSVTGSKFWFNCNPQGPSHWFLTNWIKKALELRLVYLHFTMDDNLSLSQSIKQRYETLYSGVFYKRYVRGEWSVAEGAIYLSFDRKRHVWTHEQLEEYLKTNSWSFFTIGVDFGGSESASVFTLVGFTRNFKKAIVLDEYYDKENLGADHLKQAWIKKAGLWKQMYPRITDAFMDHEMLLIKSFRQATPQVPVRHAWKSPIADRISATDMLMATDKLVVMNNCKYLIKAFESAVWDAKHPDELVRLDDGTVKIDSLDSFEYAIEKHFRDLLRI
jgi:PBSX family phage terminase large subunit